ncbi:TetR/AcrR family transcriptional regulator [Corynebacterium mastitidis]|uniref:TetR/AcrR family transcriptional regulator n=1 Tax=Corynebacterium mastitidis TaxID=161890 RepID=A0ABU8NYA6_9CORY
MRTDARERRQRIIDAACDLFRTTNPSEVTMERVADRAQVGIATLYRNFPDRAALMLHCTLYLLEVVQKIQTDTLAQFDAAPEHAERTWRRFIASLVDLGTGALVPALAPTTMKELGPQGGEHRTLVRQYTQAILDAAAAHRLVSPHLAAHEFVTQLSVLTRPPIPGVRHLNPQVTTQLVEGYLNHQRELGRAQA